MPPPQNLFNLLDHWCLASGTCFNKGKTVIIPVGSPTYRKQVSDQRKLNPLSNFTFDDSIHILKDGKLTRYLGAHLGNNVTRDEPWPKIMNDIEYSLKCWDKSFPSIEGRRHIIQMVIGRKTQFITPAQGMPCKYENLLNKRIWTYLWNSDPPPPSQC